MSLAQSERVRANSAPTTWNDLAALEEPEREQAAIASANKWVDVARPVIVAMLALADACEPLYALDSGAALEGRRVINRAQKDLLCEIENVRDEHIYRALPWNPDNTAAYDAFDDARHEILTVDAAIKLVTREMLERVL